MNYSKNSYIYTDIIEPYKMTKRDRLIEVLWYTPMKNKVVLSKEYSNNFVFTDINEEKSYHIILEEPRSMRLYNYIKDQWYMIESEHVKMIDCSNFMRYMNWLMLKTDSWESNNNKDSRMNINNQFTIIKKFNPLSIKFNTFSLWQTIYMDKILWNKIIAHMAMYVWKDLWLSKDTHQWWLRLCEINDFLIRKYEDFFLLEPKNDMLINHVSWMNLKYNDINEEILL